MALPNKPSIKNVWATSGLKVEPSDTKVNTGWIVERPPHQFQNFLQNRSDQFLKHINEAGIPVWDAVTIYTAGKSYVQGSDGLLYKAKTTGANQDPVGNPTNWMLTLGETDFQEVVQQTEDNALAAANSASEAATSEANALATVPVFDDIPPTPNLAGKQWTSALTGKKYEWIVDADSGQWVEMGPQTTFSATSIGESLSAEDGATKVGTPDGTVQDALNERLTISEAAASDGATKIGTTINDVTAVPTTVQRKVEERPSIFNYNENADNGVVDASIEAQKVAATCDANQRRFLYMPNWRGSYRWVSPVVFTNPGVRIYGDQSATYNRGGGKDGWLIGQSGLTRFFDLGASRTTGNPADQWQVDGLGFKQAVGAAPRSIDGISFTSRTNGPDRGVIIRDTSFIGLRDAITVEYPDVATVIASMNIEGCVFQGCRAAVNAKGHLNQFRFVGNQCEQNMGDSGSGVVGGLLDGPITITDNMLEGQSNCISVDIPPLTGNRPIAVVARNYFEGNTGAYVVRYRCSSTLSYLELGPNYFLTVTASDYMVFEGSNGGVVFKNNDRYPFTLKNCSMRIHYGSEPFNNQVRGYEVRQLNNTPLDPVPIPSYGASYLNEIVLKDFANLTDAAGEWTHGLPVAGTTGMTPFGVKNIQPLGSTNLAVTLSVTAGDLVCVNVLMRASELVAGTLALYVRNEAGVHLRGSAPNTGLAAELKGRWALVSLPFIAQANATTVRVLLNTVTGTYSGAIAGITVKNFGAFANTGATKTLIEPTVPNIV